MQFERESTTISPISSPDWGDSYEVAQGGSIVGVVAIFTIDDEIVMELIARETGLFQYAMDVSASRIQTLDLDLTDHASGTVQRFYPYDWNVPQATSPVPSDLLVPGVRIRLDMVTPWVYIAHHDTQLYRVDVRESGADRVARFYRQHESLNNIDRTLYNLSMSSEEVDFLRLTTAESLRQVQQRRLGTNLPMSGLITQATHRGWGSDDGYPSSDAYSVMAQRIAAGGIEHVQLRLNEPEGWVSDIFVTEGLTTHYYMFLGVARLRVVDGINCYSIRFADGAECIDGSTGDRDWVLRDSNGDIYTVSVNPTWALVDLRVREHRQAFVDRAVRAVENGFSGIFFDGPQLWGGGSREVFTVGAETTTLQLVPGDDSVGGPNTSGIGLSLYNARALLMRETRRAIREIAPGAIIGILGNEYVDFQASADYVLKEVTAWAEWPYHADPRCRVMDYGRMAAGVESEDFARLYQFYAPLPVLAIKGNNADEINALHRLAVEHGVGSHNYGDSDTQLAYIGVGDFTSDNFATDYTAAWASVIEGVAGSMQTPALPWPSDASCP